MNYEDATGVFDNLFEEVKTALVNAKSPVMEGLPNHDGDLLAAEALRNLTRMMASGQLNSMENDPLYPYFVKTISVQRRVVLPGPDTVYHVAVLDGAHNYRIYGNRGSAHIFELEVWEGHVSDLFNFKFHSTLDSFSFGPGEDFEILVSREKQEGDWIKLPEGECTLLIRQYYYDWETEQPATLAIEREGATYPPPPVTLDDMVKRFHRMVDMIRTYPMAARHGVGQHLEAPFDEMTLAPVGIGFTKLRYLHGKYLCGPDEAIILEVKPPKAEFWNFMLLNLQWEGIDYHQRQTSINGLQAHLDADGVFRAVISHRDPGVRNWLDTSGRNFGLISSRYYDPDSVPIPTLKKVAVDSVADHLPQGSVCVTPEQRQEAIRKRIWSTIRRQCSD